MSNLVFSNNDNYSWDEETKEVRITEGMYYYVIGYAESIEQARLVVKEWC